MALRSINDMALSSTKTHLRNMEFVLSIEKTTHPLKEYWKKIDFNGFWNIVSSD